MSSGIYMWLLLLGALILLSDRCLGCPLPPDSPCLCEFNSTGRNEFIINCRYIPLQQVPEFTNSSIPVYEVALYSCIITELPANAFSALNVKRIDLGANPIRTIHQDAFNGIGDTLTELILHVDQFSPPEFPVVALSVLPALELLHVSKFTIPTLPNGALSSLSSLRDLSITNSKMQSLSPDDFTNQRNTLRILQVSKNLLSDFPSQLLTALPMLQKLDLTQNEIDDQIPVNAFQNNVELQEIDLSNNKIHRIEDGAFNGISQSLKVLRIRSNRLTRFDLNKIGSLQAVEDLDLQYNGDITSIGNDVFSNMHNLKKLNFHGCYIRALTQESFNGIRDSLVILQLAENKIESIGANTFLGFTKLEDLYLSGQPMGSILNAETFMGLETSLNELSLEETGFTSQNWPAVSNLAKLTTLRLERNLINSIPEFTLKKLTQLQTLDLSFNSITEVTQRSMVGPSTSLTSIEFGNNSLTTLNECSFHGFTMLQHIGLSKNPLKCDCHLTWLRLWVEENYNDIEKLILNWKCNSPDNLKDQKFIDVTVEQLNSQCDTTPPPMVCEEFSTTTSTTLTPELSTTTPGTNTDSNPGTDPTVEPLLVNVTGITETTCTVRWYTDTTETISGFEIDLTLRQSDDPVLENTTSTDTRDYLLENLEAATDYKVCVTMLIDRSGYVKAEVGCADFTTKVTASASSEEGSQLAVILGAVFGALVLIILLVILAFLVVRYRGNVSGMLDKWTKKRETTSSSPGIPQSRTDMPVMGYNSKRFSKAKSASQEIHNQNVANRNIEHFKNYNMEPSHGPYDNSYKHIDLNRDLDRFSPEERERIINMLTHSGGSHLSTISTGSQRYVPEPPPRPPELEGYLNPRMTLDDEAGYEEPHTYVEIDDQPQISKECYI